MIKGVLLDIGGVVYVGDAALPGSVEAVTRLKDAGLPVRCITNTTRTPLAGILERLAKLGLDLSADDVFTPARAARGYLDAHDLGAHLLIHPDLEPDLADLPGGTGEAVVVGDAGDGFSYQAMNDAFRRLMAGADLVALAANRMFKDADDELSIDCGAFVAALEYASGKRAVVLGKPSPDFFAVAAETMGCTLADTVMVGDDAEADVAGALKAGAGAGVLVRTGKVSRRRRAQVRASSQSRCRRPERSGRLDPCSVLIVGEFQERVRVAGPVERTPAGEVVAAQGLEQRTSFFFAETSEPFGMHGDHLLAGRAFLADPERVAPFRRPSHVDRVLRQPPALLAFRLDTFRGHRPLQCARWDHPRTYQRAVRHRVNSRSLAAVACRGRLRA